jgi:hypothetical protein
MDDDTWTFVLRRPVKREGSGQYLVILLVSFAVSVSLTRVYLSLTGYPQIGSGEIHIAHVLWGGLLLFISALMLLLVSNRKGYRTAAILAGIGIGLFIDEVGKFITQKNDYFFPTAAPIIYIFFMLALLLLLQVRRWEKTTYRAEMCRALESLQDWIFFPLSSKEQAIMMGRLANIRDNSASETLTHLAQGILDVIEHDSRPTTAERPDRWELYLKGMDRWLSEKTLRLLLALGFLGMAFMAFKNPATSLWGSLLPPPVLNFLNLAHSGRWYGPELAPELYNTRIYLEIALGSLLLLVSLLLLLKKPKLAIPLGFGSLFLYFATIDMLLFFFEQFSTIIFVIYQVLLILGLIYYCTRFSPRNQVKW